VRIVRGKDFAFLILKTTNGLGVYDPGELNTDTSFQISLSEWNPFIREWPFVSGENEGGV